MPKARGSLISSRQRCFLQRVSERQQPSARRVIGSPQLCVVRKKGYKAYSESTHSQILSSQSNFEERRKIMACKRYGNYTSLNQPIYTLRTLSISHCLFEKEVMLICDSLQSSNAGQMLNVTHNYHHSQCLSTYVNRCLQRTHRLRHTKASTGKTGELVPL